MAGKQSLELLKAVVSTLKESKKFDRVLNKVNILGAGEGRCRAEFKVEEEHENYGGTLHGGFSATLVDIISTYALMTTEKGLPGVSVDMHMSYLKAAKEGDTVLIEAKTIKTGRTLAFLEVVLSNKETGDILVTGQHTKFIG